MKTNPHVRFILILAGSLFPVIATGAGEAGGAAPALLDEYNVRFDQAVPAMTRAASLPLGNGDVALNAWATPEGLDILIAKGDAWDQNGRLCKLGLVRVSLDPNPFAQADQVRQELRLRQAALEVIAPDGTARVWVDANRPVIHVDLQTRRPARCKAELRLIRQAARPFKPGDDSHSGKGLPGLDHEADQVAPAAAGQNRVLWYHRNNGSVYAGVLAGQRLGGLVEKYPDPLAGLTFGGCLRGQGLIQAGPQALQSGAGAARLKEDTHCASVSITVLTAKSASADEYIRQLEQLDAACRQVPPAQAWQEHTAWWERLWERSWVFVTSAKAATLDPTANTLSLRIGADSNGQHIFQGRIARAGVWTKALGDGELAALARSREADPAGEGLLANWRLDRLPVSGVFRNTVGTGLDAKAAGPWEAGPDGPRWTGRNYAQVEHDKRLNLSSYTLEAWVQPDKLPGDGARILDKSTAAKSDGYLLDTYPGQSLRGIVQTGTLGFPAGLEPGKWAHVAAVYDATTAAQRLYVNGVRVAGDGGDGQGGSAAFTVTRGYLLQRFMNVCAARSAFPIKFNGSLFIEELEDRPWGGCYWFQNTRLAYWPMPAAGDIDFMKPLWDMYLRALPLAQDRCRILHAHEGAYFPETMHFWGTPSLGDWGKGANNVCDNGYIRRYWQGGLELTAMMLDRYDHTQDPAFARDVLLPLAEPIVTFFDLHWKRENGRIRFDPAQSLETWHVAVDPLPEIAALRCVLPRLLDLPADLVRDARRQQWRRMLTELPPLPAGTKNGLAVILPAVSYSHKSNSENPELYAVFPYRLFGLGRNGLDRTGLDLAINTYQTRDFRQNAGWCQDSIQAACLGLADEAGSLLVRRCSQNVPPPTRRPPRFPAYWGPNANAVPDQDHGCNILTTLQHMLVQADGRKILLLPAWPRSWECTFRLHAPYQTVVEGTVRGGKLLDLKVTPESRRADIVLGEAWR